MLGHMRRAWAYLRCYVLRVHRWEPLLDEDEKGWTCRDCDELELERYHLERVHDWEPGSPLYTSAAGGPPPPVA